MASVNKVILVGHLGRDPESRALPSGEMVANFSMATTESWKDKSGEKKEETEWHRVSFFGKTAEVICEYVKKGSQIYVEGRLQTRKWTDKDGVEKYSTEIRGDRMQMLGSRASSDSERLQQEQQKAPEQRAKPATLDDIGDDLPF